MDEVTPEETLRKGIDDESNEGFFSKYKNFYLYIFLGVFTFITFILMISKLQLLK